jgi:hypothetical protein
MCTNTAGNPNGKAALMSWDAGQVGHVLPVTTTNHVEERRNHESRTAIFRR